MFLRRDKKPTTGVIARPNNGGEKNGGGEKNTIKALAGFDDEMETSHDEYIHKKNDVQLDNDNTFDQDGKGQKFEKEIEMNVETLYTYQQLSEMDNLQYETRLVEQILQPGGIKVKPNESLLNQFSQAAKTLNKDIIGSLLISRLQQGFPYQTKAKSLYTIQYLSKNIPIYQQYFSQFIEQIKSQPLPSDNIPSYQNLLKQILSTLQNKTIVDKNNEINIFEFNGQNNYNSDLPGTKKQIILKVQEKKKIVTKKFISPKDVKKIEQKDKKKQVELIDVEIGNNDKIDRQQNGNNKQQFNIFDLDFSVPKQQPKPSPPQVIQIPIIPPVHNPQLHQYQQNQYQQQQYQQFLYQQQQQKLQQQMYQQPQSQKVITGADLYSLYK